MGVIALRLRTIDGHFDLHHYEDSHILLFYILQNILSICRLLDVDHCSSLITNLII